MHNARKRSGDHLGARATPWTRGRVGTHGLSKTTTFKTWQCMWQRCGNPRDCHYKNYGARGIRVCDRWKSFETFLADMGHRPDGTTLDRIDVNGDYEPTNCRWATLMEQHANRRDNVLIEINGERLHAAEWARRLGVDGSLIRRRLAAGWDPVRAVTTPPIPRKERSSMKKRANEMTDLARQGDVLLMRIDAMPKGGWEKLRRVGGRVILAAGEVTGHHHAISSRGVCMLRAEGVSDAVITIASRAELSHEEHSPISIPGGIYRVRIQREWTGALSRRVED